jgi:hypothetical protein
VDLGRYGPEEEASEEEVHPVYRQVACEADVKELFGAT